MDLETSSLLVVFSINLAIILGIVIHLGFFYKWDTKTYDDMGENQQ